MIVACIYYLFAIVLAIDAEYNNDLMIENIFEKITTLSILLAPVVVVFNVGNIYSILPLCKNKNRSYAFLGKILLFDLLFIVILVAYVAIYDVIEFIV